MWEPAVSVRMGRAARRARAEVLGQLHVLQSLDRPGGLLARLQQLRAVLDVHHRTDFHRDNGSSAMASSTSPSQAGPASAKPGSHAAVERSGAATASADIAVADLAVAGAAAALPGAASDGKCCESSMDARGGRAVLPNPRAMMLAIVGAAGEDDPADAEVVYCGCCSGDNWATKEGRVILSLIHI